MQALELKIPPPIVALFIAIAMWGIARVSPSPADVSLVMRAVFAIALALAGGAIGLAGTVAFRRAKTTVNPMKPQATSSLVTTGIYKYTRNPMYMGFLFMLLGWAAFLLSPWTLAGPLAFVLYVNRFQIKPEERALAVLFGDSFSQYAADVRRWL